MIIITIIMAINVIVTMIDYDYYKYGHLLSPLFALVPSLSPMNLTVFNTSSTSIQVHWAPIPTDHVNGILRGYHVIFKKLTQPVANVTIVTVDNATLSVDLINLTKFRAYAINVSGFTVIGDGNASEDLCWTDQDSESFFIKCFRFKTLADLLVMSIF